MPTEDRYRRAAAAGGVSVWDWNLATGDIFVDPLTKELLGYGEHEIPNRLEEFQSNGQPIYIIRAHGVRSTAVCRYLNERGYSNLTNVTGGMAAVASLEGFQYD